MTRRSIAIVGAGISGAAAARRLHEAGYHVAVLDKGRGVGGRMANRRSSGGPDFDHGAQFLTARDAGFKQAVAEWRADGVLAAWAEPGWFVGCPGMPAVAAALLAGLDVTTGCTVTRLLRGADGWRLAVADGTLVAQGRAFDAVLVSCPAPQTQKLIASAGVAWPKIELARYDPCWALMCAHAGPALFTEAYKRTSDAASPCAWIARDGTKPGRTSRDETLVLHASSAWSRAHLEQDETTVQRLLHDVLRRTFALPDAAVTSMAAHRWRFASVERPLDQSCLWSAGDGLGACGDWCLGGRVEAAYLSGRALAERVLEDRA